MRGAREPSVSSRRDVTEEQWARYEFWSAFGAAERALRCADGGPHPGDGADAPIGLVLVRAVHYFEDSLRDIAHDEAVWPQHEERAFEAAVMEILHDVGGSPIPWPLPERPDDWGFLQNFWHAARAYSPGRQGRWRARPTLDGERLAVASALTRERFRVARSPMSHGYIAAALAEVAARFHNEALEAWLRQGREQELSQERDVARAMHRLLADAPGLMCVLELDSNVGVVVELAAERARQVLDGSLALRPLTGNARYDYLDTHLKDMLKSHAAHFARAAGRALKRSAPGRFTLTGKHLQNAHSKHKHLLPDPPFDTLPADLAGLGLDG